MVTYCADDQPEVRQAAAYGVGVMAQFGGAGFAPVLKRKRLLVPSSLRLYSYRRVPYPISTINTCEAMRFFGYWIWDTGYDLWIRSKEPKFN